MKKLGIAALMMAVAAPTIVVPTTAAGAQGYYRTYNGHRHYYRYRCKKSSGTTGLIAGGAHRPIGAAFADGLAGDDEACHRAVEHLGAQAGDVDPQKRI